MKDRTVKPAGKPTWASRTGPKMHGTEGERTLGKLAGRELRAGERPAMDRKRRPR